MEMAMDAPSRPLRGPHGGWQSQEIDALEKGIAEAERTGESLRSVFERLGGQLGRKPNSIRNFYYAQVRTHQEGTPERALPFETFTPEEVESLIRSVLTARAQGLSVRACVRKLAAGDRTKMLRLQNKYRSTIRTRPDLVRRIAGQLAEAGIAYVSPYAEETPEPSMAQVKKRAEQFGDPQIAQLFSALDHLMDLALSHEAPEEGTALRRADRLDARCDMLRIALDDEKTRRTHLEEEAGGMVTLLKEYIALPDADRKAQSALFCDQAAARLSAVECALMPDDGS